ncbi:MAG: phage virion morphogenesis protein [Rhodospirillales bacterium]|jgi:phage virion morphogenesis protein|nr:phage virion morphogenesis protein [Rhodospirillales bacterium]
MAVSLVYDTRELKRLSRRLRDIAERTGDLRPLMEEIGAAMVSSTVQRFEDGRGPDGKAWPKSLRARLEGGKTLVDKAHLRDSITYDAGADSVEIGTNLVYAGTHQTGAEIRAKVADYLSFRVGGRWARKKKVTIPARPYLGISAADEDEIEAIAGDYLAEPLQ